MTINISEDTDDPYSCSHAFSPLTDIASQLGEILFPGDPLFFNRTYIENISVILTNASTIQQLNARYRNVDADTDVLTFLYEEENFAEIYISCDTAQSQAKAHSLTLMEELTLLLVHGIIHTTGLDHELSENNLQETRRWESKLLKQIQSKAIPLTRVHTI